MIHVHRKRRSPRSHQRQAEFRQAVDSSEGLSRFSSLAGGLEVSGLKIASDEGEALHLPVRTYAGEYHTIRMPAMIFAAWHKPQIESGPTEFLVRAEHSNCHNRERNLCERQGCFRSVQIIRVNGWGAGGAWPLLHISPSFNSRTTSLSGAVTWVELAIFFSETEPEACSLSPMIAV